MLSLTNLVPWITEQLSLSTDSVQATIDLLDLDNTVPFIARYRKEATGGLDEEAIRNIQKLAGQFRSLNDRRQTILKSLTDQKVLTPELETAIRQTQTKTELEDLYLPYKPKRKTRASIARDHGLQELADYILSQELGNIDLQKIVQPYLSVDVQTPEAAWSGARDIVAETISDHPQVRGATRKKAERWGVLHSEKRKGAEDPRDVFKLYYDFKGRVDQLRPHQVLAINRGEAEKTLKVHLEIMERDWREAVTLVFRPHAHSPYSESPPIGDPRCRQTLTSAGDRAGYPPELDRNGREPRNSCVWRKSSRAFKSTSIGRSYYHGDRSCLSNRMQNCRH